MAPHGYSFTGENGVSYVSYVTVMTPGSPQKLPPKSAPQSNVKDAKICCSKRPAMGTPRDSYKRN